jgi:hypothetical protein
MNDSAHFELPGVSIEEMKRVMASELTMPSRLGYTALLLVSLSMSGVIAALWLTEPALPVRTQIAFALMVVIGLTWVSYATWVLTRRRVLLAGHRIIAARLAVTFCTVFALGSLALGLWTSVGRAAYAASGFGAFMLALAIGILVHARTSFARLMERRRALEIELGTMVST